MIENLVEYLYDRAPKLRMPKDGQNRGFDLPCSLEKAAELD